MMTQKIIGLDLDNTIVCCDQAIRYAANKVLNVDFPKNSKKELIKKLLVENHGEESWTTFQGYLYGPGMCNAKPYAGVLESLLKLRKFFKVFIVSHRTIYPYRGERYNLHESAKKWLKRNLQIDGIELVPPKNIFFMESLELKLKKIGNLGCSFFIDDLPKVINNEAFPKITKGILFDPDSFYRKESQSIKMSKWDDLFYLVKSNA